MPSARTCHLPAHRLELCFSLSSTWGRADQHSSHDSKRVWGVLFCAPNETPKPASASLPPHCVRALCCCRTSAGVTARIRPAIILSHVRARGRMTCQEGRLPWAEERALQQFASVSSAGGNKIPRRTGECVQSRSVGTIGSSGTNNRRKGKRWTTVVFLLYSDRLGTFSRNQHL